MLNPLAFPQHGLVFLKLGQGFQQRRPSRSQLRAAEQRQAAENTDLLDSEAEKGPDPVSATTVATEPCSQAGSQPVTGQDNQNGMDFDGKGLVWPYGSPPLRRPAMALSQLAPNAADVAAQIWAQAPSLTVVHAQSLNDADTVIKLVRSNATVVLNVEALDPALRRRVVDMVGGGLCAIDASSTEIGNHVWLLKPLLAR